jgi:hypothetical protein
VSDLKRMTTAEALAVTGRQIYGHSPCDCPPGAHSGCAIAGMEILEDEFASLTTELARLRQTLDDAEAEVARLADCLDRANTATASLYTECRVVRAERNARPTYAEVQAWRDEFGIVRRNTSGAPDRYDDLPAYVARLRRAQEVRP